jgi:hypothetical protein
MGPGRIKVAFFAITLFALGIPTTTLAADQLVGHWALVNQAIALQIVFKQDGTYWAKSPSTTMKGRWARVDDEHLATWTGESRPRRVNRFKITGRNLVIIDSNGILHVHRRQLEDIADPPKQ